MLRLYEGIIYYSQQSCDIINDKSFIIKGTIDTSREGENYEIYWFKHLSREDLYSSLLHRGDGAGRLPLADRLRFAQCQQQREQQRRRQ